MTPAPSARKNTTSSVTKSSTNNPRKSFGGRPMKHFHATAVMISTSFIATALLLSSCESSQTVKNRLVAPAQAEVDLRRALDAGAISQSEYEEELKELRDRD